MLLFNEGCGAGEQLAAETARIGALLSDMERILEGVLPDTLVNEEPPLLDRWLLGNVLTPALVGLSTGHPALPGSWVEEHVDVPREYVGWNLTTHQWRKSFAIYMVRSNEHLLPAVRDHFKHMSAAMTERGYLGRDVEMLGMLDDEATYAAAQFLFDAMNGRPAAGRMMDTIEQNAATIRELVGEEGTAEEKIDRLAVTMKDDDIRLWTSEWGNCLFRCELARCHFLAKGHFDLTARRPHYGQRQPGVCCNCANLLIFSDDVDFWEARYKSNLAVLEANRAAGERSAAAVAEDRVRSSAAILRRLGIFANFPLDDTMTEEADEFA